MPLPPLNALRAFESAARHNGFVAAADELCVTRGAVSRHIKVLEAHLGVTLFSRTARGVNLTSEGARLLPVLSRAFAMIETETARLSAAASDLRIICPPTLSIRWLLPKLDGFRRAHPDIGIRLTTDFFGDRGFDPNEHDLGLSTEIWPGRPAAIEVQPLFPMRVSLACAPALLAQLPFGAQPKDLARFTLLLDRPAAWDRELWPEHSGLSVNAFHNQDMFPDLDMAVKAAVMGAGVVIADMVLCRDELNAGSLVCPFPELTFATPLGDWALIGSSARWNTANVTAFRDWVTRIAREER